MVAILSHSITDSNLYIAANTLIFAVVLGLARSTHTTGYGDQQWDLVGHKLHITIKRLVVRGGLLVVFPVSVLIDITIKLGTAGAISFVRQRSIPNSEILRLEANAPRCIE